MCQLAWRSGCSAAGRTITSSGGPAADVPPSAANGAAVEPLQFKGQFVDGVGVQQLAIVGHSQKLAKLGVI